MALSDKQTPDSRTLSPKAPEALDEPRTNGAMLGSKTWHDPTNQKPLESKHREISGEIQSLTRAASRLKQQNRYLTAEADTTQCNINQYMVYLSHRTERRHNAIITLNDYNHQKLQTIQREKEEAIRAMQEREAQLRTEILGKEHALSTVFRELEELRPFREIQAEYLTRIVELKSELTKRRALYSEKETMVTRIFYQDLESRCKEYAEEVAQFYKRATTKADLALQAHVQWAKQENAKFRTWLLCLVWHLDKLNEKKRKLQRHNQVLLWDVQGQKAIPHIAHHQRHAGCLRQVKGENKVNQQKVWLDNSQCTDRMRPEEPQTNGVTKYPQCTPQPQPETPQTNGGAKCPHRMPQPQPETSQTNRGAKCPHRTPQPQPETPQTNGGAKCPHRMPQPQPKTPQTNGGAKCQQCTSKPEQIPSIRDPELHRLHTMETLTLALGGHKKEGNNQPMQ
uniref:DUF4515 domain-containing protein n=1 Tax=Leptobrachium leishanense TaxID=445787 RepID=A0A8C5WL74_9ANUR